MFNTKRIILFNGTKRETWPMSSKELHRTQKAKESGFLISKFFYASCLVRIYIYSFSYTY